MGRTAHLILLCHAATSSTAAAAFPPDDEPIGAGAVAALAAAGTTMRHVDRCLVSPALRARQTAAALGLTAAVEPALADCDVGRWVCRTIVDLHANEPDAVTAWRTDPAAAPHGGESLAALADRVKGWLGTRAEASGVTLAVTHAAVIRAAILAALDAPPAAFWRIDVEPLAAARLSGHGGRWTVVALGPFGAVLTAAPPQAPTPPRTPAGPG